MDYIPKYFRPYELIPKETYELLKNRPWVVWQLFDPRTLYVGDRIREKYGKMICNTWWWGGTHQYRGWRPIGCKEGAEYSQHRFGRALDLVPMGATVEDIWSDIEAGDNFNYITCIEKGSAETEITWLHFDTRNYKGLLIVYP